MKQDLSSLSLEERIGQLFVIGIAGPTVDAATRQLIEEIKPGGICLFARNIKSLDQVRELNDELHGMLSVPPMISVDEEGGLVDRLRRVMTPQPAADRLRKADDARQQGESIGETLKLLGFDIDFAPVVDVVDQGRAHYTNGLAARTYGASASEASEFARGFLSGLSAHGIAGCLKHFPGLGAAQVDSHEELPLVEIDEDEFESVDLIPYASLFAEPAAKMVMAAHVTFPNHPLQEISYDGKLIPASLSYNFITKLLRGRLGFSGVAITDDLEMGAIIRNFGIGEACVRAISAGCDQLAICADETRIRGGYQALQEAAASGEISAERLDTSLDRIAKLRSSIGPEKEYDEARLAELSATTADFAASL